MWKSSVRTALGAAAILALALPATAGTLKVPKQYETIQDAIDAANPGDKIVVSKGRYEEQLLVQDLDGLTIVGKKGAILDGFELLGGEEDATILTIENSENVTIQGLEFRWGSYHIFVDSASHGTTVAKCRSRYAQSSFVDCDADRLTVDKCVLTGFGSDGIDCDGDDARVTKNRFLIGDDGAVEIDGNNTVLEKNIGMVIEDGAMFDLDGDNVRVVGNRGGYASQCEIELDGDDGLIDRNRLKGSDGDGIDIDGDRITVSNNLIMNVDGDGVEAEGDGHEIVNNKILHALDDGINSDGHNVLIENNDVEAVDGEGVESSGDDVRILGNDIVFCEGEGIDVDGDRATVDGNSTEDTGDDGIYVYGVEFVITNNTVVGVYDDDEGIQAEAPFLDGASERGSGRIEGNRVSYVMEAGIQVWMDGGDVIGNTVQWCGGESTTDSGFEILGVGNDVENNTAMDVGADGFRLYGMDCTFVNNRVFRAERHGFVVDAWSRGSNSNSFDRCQAFDCVGEGFFNRGTQTTLTNSTFLGNWTDLSFDNVIGATWANDPDSAGNRFETGGATTASRNSEGSTYDPAD